MDEHKKNSILIVDDEKLDIAYLNGILSHDYSIFVAKSGQEALNKATELRPDLILLDIIMPDMDGYAVLAELKASEATQEISVIFITGLDSTEDEAKGLALNANDYITKPFNAGIVRLRVGNQIRLVNQMRAIEHLSMTDQLTGIANRRSFDMQMNTEWRRAIREQSPISFLMIDVDNFKDFNDTYGHQQGDVALQTVADLIKKELKRPADLAARWGGEEFAVLLPQTESDGAFIIAELIRARIERAKIQYPDGISTRVTISAGVNTQIPDRNDSLDKFISRADAALYTAKDLGRNRVST